MKKMKNKWQMKNKNSIGHNRSLLNNLPQKLIIFVLAIALLTGLVAAADITAKEGGDLYVDGNLGVGTTSPSERFEVVGNVTFPYASSAGFFYDNSTGRVGIGTTIPNHKTVIDSPVNVPALSITSSIANTQWTGIQFGYGGADGNSSQYHKAGILFERIGSNAVGSLHFANDNTADKSNVDLSDARMTITRQGNVGIGTTSPSSKLHVVGDTNLSGHLYIEGSNKNIYGPSADQLVLISSTNQYIDLQSNDDFYGVIIRQSGDTTDWANIEVSDTYLGLSMLSATPQMVIDDNGKVGIGNTKPNRTLHVSGDVNVSGNIAYGSLTQNSPNLIWTDHTFVTCARAINEQFYVEYVDENLITQREWLDENSDKWYQRDCYSKIQKRIFYESVKSNTSIKPEHIDFDWTTKTAFIKEMIPEEPPEEPEE